jgi:hypothetical protein
MVENGLDCREEIAEIVLVECLRIAFFHVMQAKDPVAMNQDRLQLQFEGMAVEKGNRA